MNTAIRQVSGLTFFLLIGLCAMPAFAAQQKNADPAPGFPNRPLRLIVPFAPQGPNDQLARMVGIKLSETWGQQVVVDNRPGGGTVIGTELAVRAPADGHTMLMISLSTAVNPMLQKKLPYNTAKDLQPLVNLAFSPNLLVTHPGVAASSVSQLLALAKAKPGSIIYASGGNGSTTHLAAELLANMGGVKMTHVPYKGANPATLDLLGGRVSCMFGTILPTLPHVKAGKLRALGVTTARRAKAAPDVPTIAESGVKGFDVSNWQGVLAPAKTPAAIVNRLNQHILAALARPGMTEALAARGLEPAGGTPAQFAALIKSEIAKYTKVVKAAKIVVD